MSVLTRLFMVLAFACGVIGLVGGLTDHPWKLRPIGWFTGGSLLALLSIAGQLHCPSSKE